MSTNADLSMNALYEEIKTLRSMLEQIKTVVKDIQTYQWHDNDHWMSVDDLREYIPTHPAKQTLYGWLSKYEIPAYRIPGMNKNLMFLQSEIDEWLLKNSITTKKMTDGVHETDITCAQNKG